MAPLCLPNWTRPIDYFNQKPGADSPGPRPAGRPPRPAHHVSSPPRQGPRAWFPHGIEPVDSMQKTHNPYSKPSKKGTGLIDGSVFRENPTKKRGQSHSAAKPPSKSPTEKRGQSHPLGSILSKIHHSSRKTTSPTNIMPKPPGRYPPPHDGAAGTPTGGTVRKLSLLRRRF